MIFRISGVFTRSFSLLSFQRSLVKSKRAASKMAAWLSKTDPNSYSNPEECQVTDVHLNLNIDFKKQILAGYVDISVDRHDAKSDSIIFDSRDLVIHNVRNKSTMKKISFELDDPFKTFGSKLTVKLPKAVAKKCVIRIDYETSPKASALQWLEPSQTAGKKHPYLFSQCQAIHARSMFPCQDTPYVKFTYTAEITAPSDLVVLMSGVRDGEEPSETEGLKTFKFIQKVPIPSYLLAIAAGALESREVSPRIHVWSEKEYVDKSAYEFGEAETMLKTAEDLLGPYVWGDYDILTLPPSFPFGGMENPCLTFVTPTLLAGDRSLASVIAHEISHSWTGNLVTNKTFEDFWLNEGFTMFVERKILGRMFGEPYRHFDALIGWEALEYGTKTLGLDNQLTKLVPDLTGIDPDDAYNEVPYEKGHTFLFYLEELLGGPGKFEPFLKSYIEKYQMQSIDTATWKAYLYEYFDDQKDVLDKVDWNAWLYTPGMPPVKPDYDRSLEKKCVELCKSWISASTEECDKFCEKDIKDFSSNQIQGFLSLLLKEGPLSEDKMERLTKAYDFANTQNAEVLFRWIRLGLISHWKPIIPFATKFVTDQGRMKYIKPVYRDMYEWEESREVAISTFKKNADGMMFVGVYNIGRILQLEKEEQ